jgi:hypothetical protein
MVEGGVDDALAGRRPAGEAVEVVERAAVDLGAGGGQLLGVRVRAHQAEHRMAAAKELLHDG